MSSFLITGGDGQLGHCFRNVAVEFPNHHLIFANRQEVDLARPETLQDFFDTNPFSGIINCAAYTQVDRAEEESEKAHQINSEGVQNLVTFAKENELNLLYEPFPAETQVDGPPRAASDRRKVSFSQNDRCYVHIDVPECHP